MLELENCHTTWDLHEKLRINLAGKITHEFGWGVPRNQKEKKPNQKRNDTNDYNAFFWMKNRIELRVDLWKQERNRLQQWNKRSMWNSKPMNTNETWEIHRKRWKEPFIWEMRWSLFPQQIHFEYQIPPTVKAMIDVYQIYITTWLTHNAFFTIYIVIATKIFSPPRKTNARFVAKLLLPNVKFGP